MVARIATMSMVDGGREKLKKALQKIKVSGDSATKTRKQTF